MWILTNTKSGQFIHLINEKPKYIVGRIGADLELNDTSVSRKHAHLQLDADAPDTISLMDDGSKYGTFHNEGITSNTALTKQQAKPLRDGDRIRFGILKNEWRLSKVPLFNMTSSLRNDKVIELQRCMQALGGQIIGTWQQNCTHLTMSEITITVKVLHALLNNVPIVSCEYWRSMLEAARAKNKSLPRAADYLPGISDMLVHTTELDFGFRAERKTLFADKTFVFMHQKHYELYGQIVQQAGGIRKTLNHGVQKTFLIKPNVVVIQYVPTTQSQNSQNINSLTDFLEANSKRIIPEYEIGLAILNCSLNKYCNPSYKQSADKMPSTMDLAVSGLDSSHVENTSAPKTSSVTTESDIEIPETDRTVSQGNDDSEIFATTSAAASVDSMDVMKTDEIAAPVVMPSIKVTQNTDDANSQAKRKRSANSNINQWDDSDSDEELFQFPKKLNLNNDMEKPTTSKNANTTATKTMTKTTDECNILAQNLPSKPLNNVTNQPKKTICIAGFLNKTQTSQASQSKSNLVVEASVVQEPANVLKRGRIAVINDDDDDDESDLFDFGRSLPATSDNSKRMRTQGNDSEDEELFNFSKSNACSKTLDENSEDADDLVPTQEFRPLFKAQNNQLNVPKPKVLPQRVSTKGWLSCSFSGMKVKDETVKDVLKTDAVAAATDDDHNASKEHKHYVESLKGGFEVRMVSISIPARNSTHQQTAAANSSVDPLNSTIKNFKAFVKKGNYKPQQEIIKLVRLPIETMRRH